MSAATRRRPASLFPDAHDPQVININLVDSFNIIRLAAEAMGKNAPESTG